MEYLDYDFLWFPQVWDVVENWKQLKRVLARKSLSVIVSLTIFPFSSSTGTFFCHATDHKHSQLWHRTNITLLALKKLWINAVNHTRHPKSHNACCFCKVLQTKMCLKEFYNYHIPAIQKDLKNLINYQPHTINA